MQLRFASVPSALYGGGIADATTACVLLTQPHVRKREGRQAYRATSLIDWHVSDAAREERPRVSLPFLFIYTYVYIHT